MAIFDIEIISEQYETLKHFQSDTREVFEILMSKTYGDAEYPFLNSIDEYGNAFFNSLQVPFLINEMLKVAAQFNDKKLDKKIEKIIKHLNKVSQFTYVHFMGE
jgi:hypothetical protein